MLSLFLSAFVTFFVVIDPPGCAPIFAGLTRGGSDAHRRSMAFRSTGIATVILILFALVGEPMLKALGISLDAFRIAGGIMVFMIALEMVFEKRTQRREDRAAEVAKDPEVEDVSIFPMAMPMIAGPGSIATVMLLTSQGPGKMLEWVGALTVTMIVCAVTLVLAERIQQWIGERTVAAFERLMGLVLVAISVEMMLGGVRAFVHQL